MKRNIILLAFVFAGLVVHGQSNLEKEVAGAVEVLRVAMVSGNKASLEKITADQLTYGHSNGKLEDKAAFVEALASGSSDFVTIELEDQTITVVDNTLALVRHKLRAKTNDNGKPGEANIGILLVWNKQRGGWKLVARQAYKL
jgi:hypothetical protein